MPLYAFDGLRVTTPASGNFYVAPTAVVIGNVEIGEDVSVWFNAVVRGDNDVIRIGAGSNVQDGAVLHVDPGFPILIGENVTIGHMAMVHGCTIGAGSLVGMAAVILNGARIGEGCLIGAGALIPEGKEIPPRSVVMGAPGKVVREVSEEDLPRVGRGAVNYRQNWRRYAARLEPMG
jgi:carbonic anhydrase/acetyltransferase-like protein (isoleucine patch superfamily)